MTLRSLMFVLFLIAMSFLILPIKVFAAESITDFKSDITINQDASVNIKESIDYQTDEAHHGIFRTIPTRYDKGDSSGEYYDIGFVLNLITDSAGKSYKYKESSSGGNTVLKIGDANKTFTGAKTYIIDYGFKYAANYFSDHDEFYLNIRDDDWTFPVDKTEATVRFSGFMPKGLKFKCFIGASGSTQECQTTQVGDAWNFQSSEPMTIVVGFDPGQIAKVERPIVKPFKLPRYETGWFFLITLVALIWLLRNYFKYGRDPAGRGSIAPEFAPPENLRPSEVGALIDEKVQMKDITATIIDFAVRGFLKIKEKDKNDFELEKIKELPEKSLEYEKEVFSALFGSGKKISLDDLKAKFYKSLPEIKDGLYEDVVKKGYFEKNPNKVRNNYLIAGILVAILPIFIFTLSATFALSLMFSGILTVIFSRAMPKKTKEGVVVKEKCLGFREFIYRADRYKVKWQEKEHIFEDFLAYAMVFGIAKQWAKHFEGIYKNPPDWYSGGNWQTFSTIYFIDSMSHFNSTAATSFGPPTSASSGGSGFGGGGFSGGGFGGGGGGSW